MNIEWLKSNVFPYANLLIFIILLIKFGKKPLQTMMKDRRNQFIKLRDEASKLLNEAKGTNDLLENRVKNLRSEIDDIARESKKAIEWEGEQMVIRAQQVAQASVADAQAQVHTLTKEAEDRLRRRLVLEISNQVATELTQKITSSTELSKKILDRDLSAAADRLGDLRP